jgi:hypothetical protein
MKRVVVSGTVIASMLCSVALFAGGETAPRVTVSPPNLRPSSGTSTGTTRPTRPGVQAVPLTGGQLAAAKSQVATAFGRTSPPSGTPLPSGLTSPLTLDEHHLQSTVGAVIGNMEVDNSQTMGTIPTLADLGVVVTPSSTVAVAYTNLQSGSLYLLDCTIDAGGVAQPVQVSLVSMGGGITGPGQPVTVVSSASVPLQSGHMLYGFPAPNGVVGVFLTSLVPANSAATLVGCTLNPV